MSRLRVVLLPLLALAVALAATGAAAVPATFSVHPAPRPLALDAGEPSIGVSWATGTVFFQSYATTYKVAFDDGVSPAKATWRNANNTAAGNTNLDPILATYGPTGRTIAGGLAGECSNLGLTTDDGATWTRVINACSPPAFDHPTIGLGPFHEPRPPTAVGDLAAYYCAQTTVQQCAASWDGGLTYGAPVYLGTQCYQFVGQLAVGPDGTVYVPARSCSALPVAAPIPRSVPAPLQQHPGVHVSRDNGLTWTASVVTADTTGRDGFDPGVAVAQGGAVYLAWQAADHAQRVAVSNDGGHTWSAPVDVSTPAGLTATTFSAVVAGDNDRAAVAFLGTTGAGDPFATPSLVESLAGIPAEAYAGTWDLYVALTYDGGATWSTVKVTGDPVQRGPICTKGVQCGGGRNLLDFFDATLDAEGRVLVAFADGCINKCALGTSAISATALGTIARQSGGTCLFAAKCG